MASSKTDLVVGLVMLDKFSKTFDKFNKDMAKGQSASKSFSNALGGIGVGLSVAAVGAFGMASVKAYGDALQSQQRLTDAFAKQPQLMGYNVQALMEYNKTLSTKIAYDDDEINAAQANLALFKLTGDQIKNLTPLVADLARRKGIDLTAAATAVGKAMQGQAKGLKDVGIVFKATGNEAQDYANITQLLNQQVGGTAEAFAQGNPLGQLENARIAFQNMQESVGQALVPAFTAITNIMTPLANALGKIPQPIMQIGIVIGGAILAGRLLGPTMSGAFMQIRASALAASASLAGAGVAIQTSGIRAVVTSGMMRGLAVAQAVAATAARGLMTALGGPWGIAIIAATTAISMFAMRSDDAATASDGFTDSLTYQNGVLDDNSVKLIANKLAAEGVYDALGSLGVNSTEFTAALISGGSARDAFVKQLQAMKDAHGATTLGSFGTEAKYLGDEMGNAANKALAALTSMSQGLDTSAIRATQAAAAATGLGAATGKVGDAVAMTTAEIVAMNAAMKVQIATNNVLSPALAKTLALLYAPKRDVAGGETVTHALKRFHDYMVLMGLAAADTAPAVQDVSSATKTLTDDQQKALDKANALGEALKSITSERDSFVAGINDASLSFASIFGFDVKGGVEASKAVTDALQAQADARAALAAIGPGDDDARAKAQLALADATAKVGKAQTDADAAKLTGTNVLNSYKGRLNKLKRFSTVMASLAKKGLSAIIYQDILSQGIDGGLEMANAINGDKALIGQLNQTSAAIVKSTSNLSARAGNYVYGGYVNDAKSMADRGANAATAAGTTPDTINVTLTLDSAVVARQLLRLKRERGGQSLGV